MHSLLACLLMVAACSSGQVEPAFSPSPSPSQQDAVAQIGEEEQIPKDAPVPLTESVPSTTRECQEACGRMLEEPYTSVAESVAEECSIDWKSESNASHACQGWDLLRNCVYAAGGKKFRKLYWREQFADYSWYKPNAGFKHSDLGKVATSNIKEIKGYKEECEASASAKPGALVKEVEVDLDGDGKTEKIRVTTTQVLVDGQAFVHKLKPYEARDMSVTVLDVDTSDAYREVMLSMYYYEQNAHRRVLYKRAKGPQLSEQFTWHDLNLKSDGKGTLRFHSGECGQERTQIYGFKKEAFKMVKKKVKGTFDEGLCSACPYVYVWQQGSWRFQGEILRNVRSAKLEDTHELRLGSQPAGTLRVQLAERKDETSFIDVLELVARYSDGSEAILLPDECRAKSAYCKLDEIHHAIARGEQVELSFDLAMPAQVRLRARGYYLPY